MCFVSDNFFNSWALFKSFSSRIILLAQFCFIIHAEWKQIFLFVECTHPTFVIFFKPFLIAKRLSYSKLSETYSCEGMKLRIEKPSIQNTCVCSLSKNTEDNLLSVEMEMLLGLSLGEMEDKSSLTYIYVFRKVLRLSSFFFYYYFFLGFSLWMRLKCWSLSVSILLT